MCIRTKNGFTLLEILVVMAIAGIMLGLGGIELTKWLKKNRIEAQIRQMATDISELRVRALSTRQRHSITLNYTSYVFKVYSTETWSSNADLLAHGTVIPGGTHNVSFGLKKSVTGNTSVNYAGTSSDIIEINERGMLSNATNATIFLGGGAKTSGGVNCLTIHTIRVNVGKENDSSGSGVCDDN